jgi:acyl-CoA dehydrogenase
MDMRLPFFEGVHQELASTLNQWCRANLHTGTHEGNVDEACRRLVTQLGEVGWLRICVPATYGGSLPELDSRALCVVRETLAYYDGLADFSFAMQGLGSGAITLAGSEALKERYLPKVAQGKAIAAFALSEPEAGSDVAAMQMTATRDGDKYV